MIAGLSWFGLSAFTHLDSSGAQQVRVELGLEQAGAVCSSSNPDVPDCAYDDRAQDRVDAEWARDARIRAAILDDLDLRIDAALDNLTEAEALLARQEFNFANYRPAAGDPVLSRLLTLPDLAPLAYETLYVDGTAVSSLLEAATYDPLRDADAGQTHAFLGQAIAGMRLQLLEHQRTVARQRSRDDDGRRLVQRGLLDRTATLIDLQVHEDRYMISSEARRWIEQGGDAELSRAAFNLADAYPAEFATALLPSAVTWDGGWQIPTWSKLHKPSVRYRSPITDDQRFELIGSLFLAFACFVFVVIGPVVTATATAREREAGTLPVLRMTGMSANDLALAMIVGPNVVALVLGGSLLLAGVVLLTLTGHFLALLLPLVLLAALATSTHLTAIGLGDALGQRVNAMVVGGLLGVAVLAPGLLGAGLAAFDVASTGLLLGPLPPLWANVAELSGIDGLGIYLSDDLTMTMLGYSVAIQLMLGMVCLGSWRRRVEQGWSPLFRPVEGVLLALASIGCSALTLLDISNHHQAQDFDALNLLTFLSSAFLLPVLAWLLVASLRRPARARAVADAVEARRAFLRFQGFIVVTAMLVGLTYNLVMNSAGLATEDSEVMWATLTQLLLLAETGVATLLWASRRREGKLRVAFLGGAVALMQLVSVAGTYGIEVEHVALNNSAAAPLLANTDVTPYWMAFLLLCWAAGLALIFTALLRRRDERIAAEKANDPTRHDGGGDEDEDDFGMPGRRLLH